MNKRAEVEACVATLVQMIDEHVELADIYALLCAVGAGCCDEELAASLLEAVTPVMLTYYIDMTARDN